MDKRERAEAETQILTQRRNMMAPLHEELLPECAVRFRQMDREFDHGQKQFDTINKKMDIVLEKLNKLGVVVHYEEKTGDRHELQLDRARDVEVRQVRSDGSQNAHIAVAEERMRGMAWRVALIAGGLIGLANVILAMLFKLWK